MTPTYPAMLLLLVLAPALAQSASLACGPLSENVATPSADLLADPSSGAGRRSLR